MPDNLFRRDGIWYARFKIKGEQIRQSLGTRSLAEARRRIAGLREEISHHRFHGTPRHSWQAAHGRWTLEVLPSISPGTAERYQCSCRMLAPHLERLFLDEIDRRAIAGIVSARLKTGASNATVRRDLTALSSILSTAVAWGWREDNPARLWDRSVIRERRDPIVLPEATEIDLVVSRASANFGRLIRFAQFTGMRQAEIVYLERRQIDAGRSAVTLTKTKRNRVRVVQLDDQAGSTLRDTVPHIASPYVFWHGAGQPFRNASSIFAALVRRCADEAKRTGRVFRPFAFHHLRHWHAVHYLKRGGNIYTLQQNLGHASIKTTEIYLDHLTPEEHARAKGRR